MQRKAEGSARLPTASRDQDVDHAYQHLRAKFVHHDIHEEKEEEDDRDEEAVTPRTRDASSVSPVVKASGSVAELCQYIHKLEAERHDLLDQVQFLRDHDATRKLQLSAAQRRVDKLESLLSQATQASDSHEQVQLQIEAAIAAERDKTQAWAQRFASLQRKCDDTERARQHAVFKLSELQTSVSEAAATRLLVSSHPTHRPHRPTSAASMSDDRDPTTGSSERLEKYKREIELLRQKLELRDAQAHEKQRLAVDLALRSAQLEHNAALEKVKLECELQLSEWRHEEAVRAKEIEAAMEEDRYSVRLELRHGMQRAQIEQRVYYLQAQATLAGSGNNSTPGPGDPGDLGDLGETPCTPMDDVLVRMQLELLRTRRFAALKKLLLIRKTCVERALRRAVTTWRLAAVQEKTLQLNAVLHMHRIVRQLEKKEVATVFYQWKTQALTVHAEAQRHRAAACWNRMLAAERVVHVLQQRTVKRVAGAFHRWRRETLRMEAGSKSPMRTPAAMGETVAGGEAASVGREESGVELQEEIKKLHEQLASSKSEASRYKRQLLKQFL